MGYVNPGTFDVWIGETLPFQSAENSKSGLGTGNYDRWLWDTKHFPEWLGLAPVAGELGVIDEPTPRGLMFIEQVRFTEPYSLQLIGGDDERLETFLAQRGIRSEDDIRTSNRTDFFPRDRPIVTPYPVVVGDDVLYPCGQVPIGFIGMWSGAIEDIDTECWALCDGTPPTPDLRDRFIVGAGGALAVGDTGGEDASDLSHTHGPGTLGTDTAANHTHGDGSYAAANDTHNHDVTGTSGDGTDHSHGDGSYAAANDTHNHDVAGTSGGGTDHTHGDGSYAAANDQHNHGPGTLSTTTASNSVDLGGSGVSGTLQTHTHDVTAGVTANDTHNHDVTGTSGIETSHTHSSGSYSAANDTHGHNVTGTSGIETSHTHGDGSFAAANDIHNHDVTGTSGDGGTHSHSVDSGVTATGGLAAHENRPSFYALALIMRIA